ncbi:MATE efflux family subfamily protein [Acanthamoeba castellanii str. Neff]|uniref:MATE efflux family subfamily protein n=1 Tax=Acanthamoeba castellanii (strain ATCC 30010 / Neff) TaxID=1257118 RepID=L8H859_ACACF|nr:MATE efflux family subfamily protein [Acanthamoeba castellanii str. Neff]ELR21350.1 MATE efflux family subfamily protein [Acanthamoeba castellanii str. Neff]
MRLAARGDAAKLERWQGRWRAFQVRASESELGVVANLAWPTVVSNLINFMLSFINLLFVGHVGDGEVELAAAALAITFTNVTGLSVGIGLLCAIDTLCSQAYGARNYRKVGLIVQRAILIVTLACVPFAAIWLSSEQIFLLLLLPGLWFYMMADVLRRWLQSQAIVKPVIYITICSVLINVLAQYVFVYLLGLGFMGSPLGLALTWACSPFLLLAYILLAGAHRKTWHGWSWECLQGWGEFLKLALPGTLMVCAEWWGFEVTVIAVGLIGEIELAAHTVAFNTLGICYMIPLGMSVAASTRVGNLLGAGDHERAKKAASICVFLTIGAQACAAGLIFVLRNVWGGLYSNDAHVVELIARVLPFAAVLTTVGAALNLFAFYCVGLPISLVLGFASPLAFFGIWSEDSFVASNANAQYHVVRTNDDDEDCDDSRSDHAQQLDEADEKRGWEADRRATVQQRADDSTPQETTTLQE